MHEDLFVNCLRPISNLTIITSVLNIFTAVAVWSDVEIKLAQYFTNVAKKVAKTVITQTWHFSNWTQESCKKFGHLLHENVSSKPFKNSPIWSHWSLTADPVISSWVRLHEFDSHFWYQLPTQSFSIQLLWGPSQRNIEISVTYPSDINHPMTSYRRYWTVILQIIYKFVANCCKKHNM